MIAKFLTFFAVGFLCVIPLGWRQCVKLVFFLVVIEGAIRKWIFPGVSDLIYFFKDFVIVAAYFKYYASTRGTTRIAVPGEITRRALILLAAIVIALQIANPSSGSPLLGVLGARNYLLYIPLMFLVGDLFRSRDELVSFLQWYLLLTIPVGLLALRQNLAPAESALNIYARGEGYQPAMVGTAVRVTGTFSYIAGYASYLQTAAALVIPLLVLELPPRWKWAMRTVLVFVLASIFLTGSRGPMFGMVVFLLLYFILNRVLRQLRLYHKFVTPALLCLIPFMLWFGPQIHAFLERASGTQDIVPRVVESFMSPFTSLPYVGIVGYGAGSAYQAAEVIRGMFSLPPGDPIPVFLESEPQRVMFELGPIGFFLWYLLRIHLIFALWRTHRRARAPLYRELAITACLVHAISLNGQMVFQITFMVYYWFLAGLIYLIPYLEAQEQRAREQTNSPPTEAAA